VVDAIAGTRWTAAHIELDGGAAMLFDAWNYRPDAGWSADHELTGYHVEATDGRIGKVNESAHALDLSYLVVDTGPWIFGHRAVVPAGTVANIDHDGRRVYLDRTKEQVRSAPAFEADLHEEPAYRDKVRDHFQGTYPA
jgi:hypothetical protein